MTRDDKMNTKQLVFAALCTALGVALPSFLHFIPNAGNVLLPMHLPVLLCGFLCAWPYALLCGVLTPVLSFLLLNMPTAASLPPMVAELALYGAIPALLSPRIRAKASAAQVLFPLIMAMLAGRLAGGLLKAFIFRAGAYSLQIWLTASFITGIPGILAQLVIVPMLVLLLRRVKL